MANRVVEKIAEEWILVLSLMGFLVTSLYLKRFPAYDKADLEVVYILFVFLVIVKGLERTNFLHAVAARFRRGRWLSLKLVLLTAILSIFVTNDVAILTVVPMTLALDVDDPEMLVILETLAANAASALSPFGNPQNIFIYFHYHLHPLEFVRAIALFCLVSVGFILVIAWKKRLINITGNGDRDRNVAWNAYVYLGLFLIFVLAVLKIFPLAVGWTAIVYTVLLDRKSLSIDWLLLMTFFAFFGFTDNLIKIVSLAIENPLEAFLYPALGSQVMSNVPSTLFFADLTNNWQALLWGVSVGGLGNLIGSLASLISYRLYRARFGGSIRYLMRFHLYGYATFLLGLLVYFLSRKM
ncbi:MAG: hypothetical protein JRI80_09230 [Deltaproteobacteria bacterium]|nr:hypothetical protein [Deltaproteobacteria bacterium]